MALTRQDVDYAFRMLLGRVPESEETIDFHLSKFPDVPALRNHLLNSRGFRDAYWSMMAQRKRDPESSELDFATEKLVFLHIPKNAGTTLTRILDKEFTAAEIYPHLSLIGHYPASFIARHKLFHGHFTLHEIQYIPGEKRIFTLLRKPRARILSQYHFHKSMKVEGDPDKLPIVSKAKLPLKQFLRDPDVRVHLSVDNMQTRYLFYISPEIRKKLDPLPVAEEDAFSSVPRKVALEVAKENLERLFAFGLVEEFDKFLELLFTKRGLPPPSSYERQNVTSTLARTNPKLHARVDIEQPDDEAHGLLDELVELDEELYRFAVNLFNRRYQRHLTHRREPQEVAV
jgi:hypothetical protein